MSAITARSMTAMSDQDRSSASPAASTSSGAPAGFSTHRRSGDGLQAVIPGWSEGPDPESRDSGFALRAPRNDEKQQLVITGESERSSTPRPLRLITNAAGYWVPPASPGRTDVYYAPPGAPRGGRIN